MATTVYTLGGAFSGMAADSLTALAVLLLASAAIGAILEWVWNTVHYGHRSDK